MMHYKEVQPISETEAQVALASGIPEVICDALVRLAYHDPDWQYVQDLCMRFADSPSTEISGLAVTCLGHLARLHGKLDLGKVAPLLERLGRRPDIAGRVEDAWDDIKMFLAKNNSSELSN